MAILSWLSERSDSLIAFSPVMGKGGAGGMSGQDFYFAGWFE